MINDELQTGNDDHRRVASAQDYEVRYFAHENDLTLAEATETIARLGNDRVRLDAAAPQFKIG